MVVFEFFFAAEKMLQQFFIQCYAEFIEYTPVCHRRNKQYSHREQTCTDRALHALDP
jgi:hypothetical protein